MAESFNPISRRRFLQQSSALGLALAAAGSQRGETVGYPARRPNLILILTDDQRWDTLGCMGNPIIQTPHLDRLAREGIVFDNHFCTTSICMSSRASIFTGLYTRSHTIDSFALPLPDDIYAASYPAWLRQAGYRVGFIGKWGLGGDLPRERFDYFEGFTGQGVYFHDINGQETHLTRIMGNQAEEFLRGCAPNQPFCLSISTKAPHVQDGDPDPFRYDPVYKDLYRDISIPPPQTADSVYFEKMPEFIRTSEGRTRWQSRFATPELYQHSVKGYYRLITGVDDMVGRIVALLEELRLADNTVILFTSDNGFFLGEHGMAGKWLMHEESIRTPLLVWDPRIKPARRGHRRREMTLNIDIAPTLLDLAGLGIPPFIQGRSLVPLLGPEEAGWRKEWFYEHPFRYEGKIPVSEGIRTARWKYIRYVETDPLFEELYDLSADPLETTNLAANPSCQMTLNTLRFRWRQWREALSAWRLDPDGEWHDPV